jgi:hypothetical protein
MPASRRVQLTFFLQLLIKLSNSDFKSVMHFYLVCLGLPKFITILFVRTALYQSNTLPNALNEAMAIRLLFVCADVVDAAMLLGDTFVAAPKKKIFKLVRYCILLHYEIFKLNKWDDELKNGYV